MVSWLTWVRSPFARLKYPINVGIVLLVLQAFLWISADYIYGAYAPTVRNVMTIYFILYCMVWASSALKPTTFTSKENWWNFIFIFIATSAVLLGAAAALPAITGVIAGTSGSVVATISIASWGFGFLHSGIKAFIEESIFRDALPLKFGLGDYVSNVLFGLFHLSVLTVAGVGWPVAIMSMFILMSLGLIWAKVRNGFGILGSTASHFAYNAFAMGSLGFIFTGSMV